MATQFDSTAWDYSAEGSGLDYDHYYDFEVMSTIRAQPRDKRIVRTTNLGVPLTRIGSVALYQELDLPPAQWIVNGMIVEDGHHVIFAPSDTKKTFLALHLSGCISNGNPFHGQDTAQGGVVYVVGEGLREVVKRRDAWQRHHEAQKVPYIVPEPVNLGNATQIQNLIDVVNRIDEPIRLIIFDTLTDCAAGIELSNPDDYSAKVTPSVRKIIRETGASTLFIHHTGHDEKSERGARAIRDSADASFKLSNPSRDTVKLTCQKLRSEEKTKPLTFRIAKAHGSLILEPIDSSATNETEDQPRRERRPRMGRLRVTAKQKLMAVLEGTNSIHINELALQANVPLKTAENIVGELVKEHQVRRVSKGVYGLIRDA